MRKLDGSCRVTHRPPALLLLLAGQFLAALVDAGLKSTLRQVLCCLSHFGRVQARLARARSLHLAIVQVHPGVAVRRARRAAGLAAPLAGSRRAQSCLMNHLRQLFVRCLMPDVIPLQKLLGQRFKGIGNGRRRSAPAGAPPHSRHVRVH